MPGGYTHMVLVPLASCLVVLISTVSQLYYDVEYYDNSVVSFLHGDKERLAGNSPIYRRLMIYEAMAIFGEMAFQAGAEILFFGFDDKFRVGGHAWFRWLKCITWSHASARCSHATINMIRLENESRDEQVGVTLGTHRGVPFLDLSNKQQAAKYWLYVIHEITRVRGSKFMPLRALIEFFDEIWLHY